MELLCLNKSIVYIATVGNTIQTVNSPMFESIIYSQVLRAQVWVGIVARVPDIWAVDVHHIKADTQLQQGENDPQEGAQDQGPPPHPLHQGEPHEGEGEVEGGSDGGHPDGLTWVPDARHANDACAVVPGIHKYI